MKISYAITVKDELLEIRCLLSSLLEHKRQEDEIVIYWDNKGSGKVLEYITSPNNQKNQVKVISDTFNNNFAEWKNKLNSECTGDYIFQIDADEIPHTDLIKILPQMLEENPGVDMFVVPRINTVEGITQEHIQKWRWNTNDKGWINFPDYQTRIYRNKPGIKWVGNVHERITGTKTFSPLPAEEWWCLYHPKTIERQEKQNNYYDML